jgi:hypothetical protein
MRIKGIDESLLSLPPLGRSIRPFNHPKTNLLIQSLSYRTASITMALELLFLLRLSGK